MTVTIKGVMIPTVKGIMTLSKVTPDEATHEARIDFEGEELGSVDTAVYVLKDKEYQAAATPDTGSTTKARATVPSEWPEGSGQIFLKGSRGRRTNTVPFDVIRR